jgi:plasmid maintenance system antidote protein VapI
MKLLFDQNLSPRLATRLQDLFPDSSHVFWLNLDQAEGDLAPNRQLHDRASGKPAASSLRGHRTAFRKRQHRHSLVTLA